MENFRAVLQSEYLRRHSKNPHYSLRAYAKHLGIYHATLSALLSGKRKITEKTFHRISASIGLSPAEAKRAYTTQQPTAETSASFHALEQDSFQLMAEWHYDAILELSQIKGLRLKPQVIASALGISAVLARAALETLERLGLLRAKKDSTYELTHRNTTNILDQNLTSAAMKKYQEKILEKSLDALASVPKTEREHASTTMAIHKSDLPQVKDLIKNFRYELANYLQREGIYPNEVYQLQVSFFPLSNLNKKR